MRCLLPSLVASLFLAACATVPATMDPAAIGQSECRIG